MSEAHLIIDSVCVWKEFYELSILSTQSYYIQYALWKLEYFPNLDIIANVNASIQKFPIQWKNAESQHWKILF